MGIRGDNRTERLMILDALTQVSAMQAFEAGQCRPIRLIAGRRRAGSARVNQSCYRRGEACAVRQKYDLRRSAGRTASSRDEVGRR